MFRTPGLSLNSIQLNSKRFIFAPTDHESWHREPDEVGHPGDQEAGNHEDQLPSGVSLVTQLLPGLVVGRLLRHEDHGDVLPPGGGPAPAQLIRHRVGGGEREAARDVGGVLEADCFQVNSKYSLYQISYFLSINICWHLILYCG